jgi:hypothetical protein
MKEDGENCIMRSFTVSIHSQYQMLFKYQIKEDQTGKMWKINTYKMFVRISE